MSRIQRFGMVIGVNPEKIEQYKALHAYTHAGVRDLLQKYNLRNFSIFIQRMPDGKDYLFGYYEYDGKDYEQDMRDLADEPRNIAWLEQCDPCQMPLPGHTSWTPMAEVYHND